MRKYRLRCDETIRRVEIRWRIRLGLFAVICEMARTVTEMTTERPTLPLEKAAPVLASHISRVRARMGLVALATGIAMTVPILVLWLTVVAPVDFVVELPRWARAVFLGVAVGASFVVAWWSGLRHWLKVPPPDSVALAIERAVPEFRTRFIAAVQLSRRPEDAARPLVKALVKDTVEIARGVKFDAVVKTERLQRWVRIAGCALGLAACAWWLGGKVSLPLFKRALLFETPVPRKTQITAFTGDRVIALGDDFRIEASAAGVVPAGGQLWIKTARGKRQEFAFDADPLNAARFFRTLQSVQEGFDYGIALGDAKTRSARVRVRPRPTILGLECEQQWPAYTGNPPQRRSPGELKLLAGSKLVVRVKPGAILSEAHLQLVGTDRAKIVADVLMKADAVMPGQIADWKGEVGIPLTGVAGVTFRLVDEEGVESRGMATYRIEVVPDQPPTLRVLWPERREELVTSRATLLVAFEAKDDFGIGRIKLHYAVNWSDGAVHRTLDLDLGGTEPKSLTRRFDWKLARINPPLSEGDVMDYWFEAVDTNDVTGPGVSILADHYQARVVSDEDKRADLANRLQDTLRGLDEVKSGQEDLARRLGELIHEK
jgi:hypothetical protein